MATFGLPQGKPNVDSLMLLWSVLLHELGERCCTSTSLDLAKAKVRFEHEGVSFLTITLPAFCKDFEKSLEDGKVSRDLFTGFRWKGGLPLFLGGFLDRVFDRGSGLLFEDPDVDSIHAVRQLTLMFGKMLLPCSKSREAAAIAGYLNVEKELKQADGQTTLAGSQESRQPFCGDVDNANRRREDLRRVAHLLFRDVFTRLDRRAYDSDWMGRHGPGSTADQLLGNRKWDQDEWTLRLEQWFPFGEHFVPTLRYAQEQYSKVQLHEPGDERPVKVILVPKTLKTPRIIAKEPTCMQFMQQAISMEMTDLIETQKVLNKMIGFTEQEPNQVLARVGSSQGTLATLDMSEASDRVSNQHVRWMFERFPSLSGAVDACRSRRADVPGHGVIRLAKFASMGSALTFPVEAMMFLSLIFLGIEREQGSPMTRKRIKSLSDQVRVYGDDLIVPVRYVPSVIQTLSDFGHKVNLSKSFWNGKFRESCGKEYYDGVDVSICRVRRVLPASRTDVSEIISLVSLRNQFYHAGLWMTARHLDRIVEPLLWKHGKSHYPVIETDVRSISFRGNEFLQKFESIEGSPLLGRQSVCFRSTGDTIDPDLQVPLARGFVVHAPSPDSHLDGVGALLKCLLKRGEQPFADSKHLERQGRPQSVNIKLRYAKTW